MGFYGHVGHVDHVGQTFFVFFSGLGWGGKHGVQVGRAVPFSCPTKRERHCVGEDSDAALVFGRGFHQ